MNETKDRTDLETVLALKAQLEAVTEVAETANREKSAKQAEINILKAHLKASLTIRGRLEGLVGKLEAVTAERDRIRAKRDGRISEYQAIINELEAEREGNSRLRSQLAAAHEALRVFAARIHWAKRDDLNYMQVWYGPAKPWEIAQKALEGK